MLGFSNTGGTHLQRPHRPPPPVALTLAGHDPSSGAGITADLQVFAAHGIFGTSVATALTAQSTLGVASIMPVSGTFFADALEHLHADLPPAGVKIGMLGSAEITTEVARYLRRTSANSQIPSVFDPVLRSSSGTDLLDIEGIRTLHSALLPIVQWLTPNWAELAALAATNVSSAVEAEAAAHLLGERYPNLYVVVTGGDQPYPVDLLRLPSGEVHRFPGEHIQTTSTHGTGCAFSSALLSRIILGDTPKSAVQNAKDYVAEALGSAPGIGHGRGPLNLLWPLKTT
jgi:hydroxymethylpyrimidine/phosphomethylpyrimidine kinase